MTSPLAGKRVVNTRAVHQSAELDRLLRDHGAVPLSFPCIAIGPPADAAPLDAALGRLAEGSFEWVVFTSANTVEAVAVRLSAELSAEPGWLGEREPVEGSLARTEDHRRSSLTGQTRPIFSHPERSDGSPACGATPSGEDGPPIHHDDAGEREPARGSPTAVVEPAIDGSSRSGQEVLSACHPERSVGSRRSLSTHADESRALLDFPGAEVRGPVKSSPTGTGDLVEQPVGGEFANLRIPASERRLVLGPGDQPWPTALTPPAAAPARVAVVGPATEEAVARLLGWPVDVRPEVETAAELSRSMPVAPGDRVLLPKSALAGPALAAILRGRGAEVTEVVAYEATTGAGGVDLASLLAAGEVDAICFTSGSTVRGCLDRLGGAAIPDGVRIACIGTETAAVAALLGLTVAVVPDEPTASAMVTALAAAFAEDRA